MNDDPLPPVRPRHRPGAGVLVFAKRQPDWFDEGDGEIATGIAAHVVVAIQHQRLSEEQRRLASVEGRARQLEERVERLRGALSERYRFERIVGQAPAFRAALDQAARVASAETTVLLTGESGTGKELVARAIHYASRRAEGPFVAVNCAALPETLIESELFGHERGAFTGADKLKRGRFELAAAGTLFLDEIGELAPVFQTKLLRVLQEHQYERVGGIASQLGGTWRGEMWAVGTDTTSVVFNRDVTLEIKDDATYRLTLTRSGGTTTSNDSGVAVRDGGAVILKSSKGQWIRLQRTNDNKLYGVFDSFGAPHAHHGRAGSVSRRP